MDTLHELTFIGFCNFTNIFRHFFYYGENNKTRQINYQLDVIFYYNVPRISIDDEILLNLPLHYFESRYNFNISTWVADLSSTAIATVVSLS